jgi:hypothetical protein
MALLQSSSQFRSYFSSYIGLSQTERRLLKPPPSPNPQVTSLRSQQPSSLNRAATTAWDLRVTGANVALEALRRGIRYQSRPSVNTARKKKRISPGQVQKPLKIESTHRKDHQSWRLKPAAHLRSASANPHPLPSPPGPKPLPPSASLKHLRSKSSSSPIRYRYTRRVIQTAVFKPSRVLCSEESPTKRLYKRLVQRTSEQIAREQLQGWN